MIKIAYLTSGQIIIGECADGDNEFTEPFEIFATPKAIPTQDSSVEVAMMPFGSLFGMLPALRKFVSTDFNTITTAPAPADFANQYVGFRDKHLYDLARFLTAPQGSAQ